VPDFGVVNAVREGVPHPLGEHHCYHHLVFALGISVAVGASLPASTSDYQMYAVGTPLQGYLAHKKQAPPKCSHMALGIVLL